MNTTLLNELREFWFFIWDYWFQRILVVYRQSESVKDLVVDGLYSKRGKYTRPFIHSGMVGLLFMGITVGPSVLEEQNDVLGDQSLSRVQVLGLSTTEVYAQGTTTVSGEGVVAYRGGEVIDYSVQGGETLSEIAQKFNLKVDTILWANGLDGPKAKIREGQVLKIPPVDGVVHKVRKGETVYSVAKKFQTSPQGLVDYPFNTFVDDEQFTLAIGQVLMVPDGIMPNEAPAVPTQYLAKQLTPDAGAVSATGGFVWPTSGQISQGYRWYHKAVDIANGIGTSILAADSGTVTTAGWPDNTGYGNRVVIDHGNGYVTLYAHMSRVDVVSGQTVKRGDQIGGMGSTGRSTGSHLHFEIRAAGALQNPLNFLK
jgi:murein DD-endopeptidase MepM/ murein hydrolase activator NlpD